MKFGLILTLPNLTLPKLRMLNLNSSVVFLIVIRIWEREGTSRPSLHSQFQRFFMNIKFSCVQKKLSTVANPAGSSGPNDSPVTHE
jgi:hypothetical protein